MTVLNYQGYAIHIALAGCLLEISRTGPVVHHLVHRL